MASLKEVKTRINSVQSTRKITSAMKMVASAKLHKAQGAIENMLPYQRQMNKILRNFLSGELSIESPYIQGREVKRVAIVMFSSNSSLCGAFNANVIKMFLHTVGEYRKLGQDNIFIYPVGRKVEEAVKKMGFVPKGSYQQLADKPTYQEAATLAEHLMELFVSKEIDRVELIYHHFKSMGVQELLRERYLPIDLTQVEEEHEEDIEEDKVVKDYIVEPSREQFIADLIPKVLKQKLFTAAMDSNASEHAARTLAMQVATDNANELIQDLTKQYNKGRQQAITNELLDIIGGSMKIKSNVTQSHCSLFLSIGLTLYLFIYFSCFLLLQ